MAETEYNLEPIFPQLTEAELQAITYPALPTMTNATCDDELVDLWLDNRNSMLTRESYAKAVHDFRAFACCQIRALKLEHMVAYKKHLATLISEETGKPYAKASQAARLAAVKSLLTFAHETGYTPFNVGRAVKADKVKEVRAERIMSETEIFKMVEAPNNPRNKLLIRLLYRSAARASELIAANWCDLKEREDGGQITLFGKGSKTRAVLIHKELWEALQASREGASDEDPLFTTYAGRISRTQLWRVVKKTALKAGVNPKISTHWLRHAHASHSLDRGASIGLVSKTLGHADIKTTSIYVHAKPDESSGTFLKAG